MGANNSIFNNVPNGWCICGGMVVPSRKISNV